MHFHFTQMYDAHLLNNFFFSLAFNNNKSVFFRALNFLPDFYRSGSHFITK